MQQAYAVLFLPGLVSEQSRLASERV